MDKKFSLHLPSIVFVAVFSTMLSACGGGGGGGGGGSAGSVPTTATVTANFSFDLPYLLTSGTFSSPFGVVQTNATNSAQITYGAVVYDPATQTYHPLSLVVYGSFSIPADSLRVSNVNGTTGVVTGFRQLYDNQTWIQVTDMKVDAAAFTNANAAGDPMAIWRLVANGATNVVGRNGNATASSSSLYCGRNHTGAAANLTNTATDIKQFLLNC